MYEGEEDHEVLKVRLKNINDFLCRGRTSDGTRCTVWEGGDLKWLCRKAGLSGNFATHDHCLWCYVPRSQLASLEVFPARTIASNRRYAHLPPLLEDDTAVFPFTCDACHITFNNAESVEAEALSETQLKEFPTIHKGLKWHQAALSPTPIANMVPCVLHMRLRYAIS